MLRISHADIIPLPKEKGIPRYQPISSRFEGAAAPLPRGEAVIVPMRVQLVGIMPDGTWGVAAPTDSPVQKYLSGSRFRETGGTVQQLRNGEANGTLMNGTIRIGALVELWTDEETMDETYVLFLHSKAWRDDEKQLEIPKRQYKEAFRLIRKEFPDLFTSSACPDGWDEYLAEVAARDLPNLVPEVRVVRLGWACIHGKTQFWIGHQAYYATCEMPIVAAEDTSEVFARGFNFLEVGHDNEVITMLFVALHLSLLLYWLRKGGVDFSAVFFLKGRRMLLKTAVVKEISFIFETNRKHATTRITSTPATIQDSITRQRHQLVALDDFSNSTSLSAKESRENAEKVVRAVGDGIFPTKRDVTNFASIVRNAVECVVVLTAEEELSLAESSLARMITLEVEEGTFDGVVLRMFQQDPSIMRRYAALFVQYLTLNGPTIAEFAKERFPVYLANESQDVSFRRYASDAAALRIVIDVISRFAIACGFDNERTNVFHENANEAVSAVLRRNLQTTRQKKPSLRFLQAVWAIKDSSVDAMVAKDADAFFANEKAYIGYVDDKLLRLHFEKIWSLLGAYFRKQGETWLPSQKTVKEALVREGFAIGKLVSAGAAKNEFVIREKRGSRPRLLVLMVDKVEESLEGLE